MNRRKALVLISGLQAMLLGILIALFAADVIRPVVFAAIVAIVAAVFAALTIVAIRKLPPV